MSLCRSCVMPAIDLSACAFGVWIHTRNLKVIRLRTLMSMGFFFICEIYMYMPTSRIYGLCNLHLCTRFFIDALGDFHAHVIACSVCYCVLLWLWFAWYILTFVNLIWLMFFNLKWILLLDYLCWCIWDMEFSTSAWIYFYLFAHGWFLCIWYCLRFWKN